MEHESLTQITWDLSIERSPIETVGNMNWWRTMEILNWHCTFFLTYSVSKQIRIHEAGASYVSCSLSRARLGHQPFSQLKAQIGGQHTLTIVQLSSNQGWHFLSLCFIIPRKNQSGLMAAENETHFWAELLPGLPELPKTISDLPPELLCNIFSFLSFGELKTALLVCRSFNQYM